MENNFVPVVSVKAMYDFLCDVCKGENWCVQLHEHRGTIGGKLYGYRWSNNSWAEWFDFNNTNIYASDFWQMCDAYTVNYIEREVKRDGEYVSIIHAYKG